MYHITAPKIIIVRESITEIKALFKKSSNIIVPRLRMLMEIKKLENKGLSKRYLSEIIGVNYNSIQPWRTMYTIGGIELL